MNRMDGRIDPARIGTSGAAPGMVLTTDGVRTTWASAVASDLAAVIWHGPTSVSSNVLPSGVLALRASTVTAVRVRVGTAPTGSDLTVVTKRNGSTVATTTVTAGSTSGDTVGLSVPVAALDLFTFDITAVGSTFAGSDVLVAIEAA